MKTSVQYKLLYGLFKTIGEIIVHPELMAAGIRKLIGGQTDGR